MGGLAAQTPMSGEQALREACVRNQAADAEFVPVDGPCWRTRIRLLQVNEDSLLVEPPTAGGLVVPVAPKTQVLAHFSLNGQRFGFRTCTRGTTRLKLNAAMGMEALVLALPDEVQYSQRRQYFRVSTPWQETIICRFTRVPEPTDEAEPPLPAEQGPGGPVAQEAEVMWTGRLVDISVGGIRVLAGRSERVRPRVNDLFSVLFELPEPAGLFHLIVRVRHARVIERQDSCIVGLQLVSEADGKPLRRSMDRLSRHVLERQRRKRPAPR